MRLAIPTLAILLTATPALAQTATELNSQGMRLYKQKKYEEAMAKFEAAVEKDPKHALAHYNLACTRGVIRAAGKSDLCTEISRPKIIENLKEAIRLKPEVAKGAVKDADLKGVRDTFYFQTTLLGLSLNKDVQKLLERVSWYGRAGTGTFTPTLKLQAGGKLLFTTATMNDEGELKSLKLPGRYKVSGLTVEVELTRPLDGKKSFTGKLGPDGKLVFPDPLGTFDDDPAECQGA